MACRLLTALQGIRSRYTLIRDLQSLQFVHVVNLLREHRGRLKIYLVSGQIL